MWAKISSSLGILFVDQQPPQTNKRIILQYTKSIKQRFIENYQSTDTDRQDFIEYYKPTNYFFSFLLFNYHDAKLLRLLFSNYNVETRRTVRVF